MNTELFIGNEFVPSAAGRRYDVVNPATEEVLARTTTVADFYYAMSERFPYAHLNHLSNEMNANVFKGNRDWHWREEE